MPEIAVAGADAEVADAVEEEVAEGAVAVIEKRNLGLGIGWRPELALMIDRRRELNFVEITAEHFEIAALPMALERLRDQGRTIIPHGISVSLGSADGINEHGVRQLDRLARHFASPFVSEHLAFVRAGGVEAGHLMPLPRTSNALNIVVENIKHAQEMLSVPLAIENISALFAWPTSEMSDGAFLREVLERTGTLLLLDTSNVYANAHNLKLNVDAFLSEIPLERLAYVHVGGGEERDGIYFDTHGDSVTEEALKVVEELSARVELPGVMLERDDHFPTENEMAEELKRISSAVRCGAERRRA